MTGTNGNGSNGNGNGAKVGTSRVKMGLAQMLKGGVIVSKRGVLSAVFFVRAIVCQGDSLWHT